MLKNKAWVIVSLLLALTMVFIGCPTEPKDKDKDKETEWGYPLPGKNYIEITSRQNNWDSVDIKAGKANGGENFTANKSHTITVYGSAAAGTSPILFNNTDAPYNSVERGSTSANGQGNFTLKNEYTWAELTDEAQNIRIQVKQEAPFPAFKIYEIIINDGTEDIYKLSEDPEVQGKENGDALFPGGDDAPPLVWLQNAGGPVTRVIKSGEAPPPPVTCEYDDCDCEECPGEGCNCKASTSELDAALFAAVTGLTGVFANEWGDEGRMVADDETGIIARDADAEGSSLFSIDVSDLTIASTDTIVITWAALVEGQVKLTAKQMPFADLSPATYLDLTAASDFGYVQGVTTIPASRYSGTEKLAFQDNGGGTWQLKIVSVSAGKAVTFDADNLSADDAQGTVVPYGGGIGYTWTASADGGWGNGFASFKFDLGEPLSGFSKVTFNYVGVGGDFDFKGVKFFADADAAPTGYLNGDDGLAATASTGDAKPAGKPVSISLDISDNAESGSDLYFTIYVPMGINDGASSYTIYGVTFVK